MTRYDARIPHTRTPKEAYRDGNWRIKTYGGRGLYRALLSHAGHDDKEAIEKLDVGEVLMVKADDPARRGEDIRAGQTGWVTDREVRKG